MRPSILLHIILLMLLSPFTVNAFRSFAHLEKWAGKYPFGDIGGGKKENFFELPEIQGPISHLLSKGDFKLLTETYSVRTPIDLIDGYLAIKGCKPHMCPGKNALLVIGLRNNSVWVLFWDGSNGYNDARSTRCFSTGVTIAEIPNGVKETFLEMHIPRMTTDEKLLPENPWLEEVLCNGH